MPQDFPSQQQTFANLRGSETPYLELRDRTGSGHASGQSGHDVVEQPGSHRGATTELFKVIGGGHTWPGSNFSIGVTNQDINASIEIWKFFSRYDINGVIGVNTLITEESIENKEIVKIVDILGRETDLRKNTFLLFIYNDYTVKRKMIIE